MPLGLMHKPAERGKGGEQVLVDDNPKSEDKSMTRHVTVCCKPSGVVHIIWQITVAWAEMCCKPIHSESYMSKSHVSGRRFDKQGG